MPNCFPNAVAFSKVLDTFKTNVLAKWGMPCFHPWSMHACPAVHSSRSFRYFRFRTVKSFFSYSPAFVITSRPTKRIYFTLLFIYFNDIYDSYCVHKMPGSMLLSKMPVSYREIVVSWYWQLRVGVAGEDYDSSPSNYCIQMYVAKRKCWLLLNTNMHWMLWFCVSLKGKIHSLLYIAFNQVQMGSCYSFFLALSLLYALGKLPLLCKNIKVNIYSQISENSNYRIERSNFHSL